MSILGEIQALCANENLAYLSAEDGPKVRSVYAAEPLWRILCGPWVSDDEERQAGTLNNYLAHFIQGGELIVSADPRELVCQLKRLEPPPPEIWEMRVSEPSPGIRVFGRFAHKDIFIALLWEDRILLGPFGSRRWKYFASKCEQDWHKYFPRHNPVEGRSINEYLSNATVADDWEWGSSIP
jgi:hypothetical protein